jgi:hypothetical protein
MEDPQSTHLMKLKKKNLGFGHGFFLAKFHHLVTKNYAYKLPIGIWNIGF